MTASWLAACLLLPALGAAKGESGQDPILEALTQELERSKKHLQGRGEDSLYYLSYRVTDGWFFNEVASFGVMENVISTRLPHAGRIRYLDVVARVGSRKLDNTHKIRGAFSFGFDRFFGGTYLPVEDDVGALRVGIWRATDRAYKAAVKQLFKVKADKTVKVEEQDEADDFSVEAPHVHLGPRLEMELDQGRHRAMLERLSAIFKRHPQVLRSSVSLSGGGGTTYFVDTEGTRIRQGRYFVRLSISGAVKADDGMDLELYDSFEANSPEQLPKEEVLEGRVRALIDKLTALRNAPVVEPYSGPAIIANRAAAVFFHEIFGHRVEGHRQKDADEGQTFTKKIGQKIVPEFISVFDDPTRSTFDGVPLNGHYLYDDEGVPAQRASLVEQGVLKGFLMSRSPVSGFSKSNGHGRAQTGMHPVARQGNLFVESTMKVPFSKLRALLIEEVKKRGKPYGLLFEDISGGFTLTRAGAMPQAFKVIPLVVRRVYPDGRPDELVRGVDIVGTPLQSFEKILATGDDPAVFNGFCGAESGYVPVSAIAPSLLIGEIEVERKAKSHHRPPLLPPPLFSEPKAIAKEQP